MIEEKKEIEKLKRELKLKKKVLDSIVNNKKEHNKILKDNFEIWSYFRKFRDPSHIEQQFLLGTPEKPIQARYCGWFNQIKEDLQRLEREIEEKEYLLQQKLFLEKQQEFLEIQKEDINENKKDREKINNFTFILALGVLSATIYYIAQLFIQFKSFSTLHVLLFVGISICGLALLLLFIIDSFKVKENFIATWKKGWYWILILVILMLVFFYFIITIQDAPTTMNTQNELNQNVQITNNLLNQSINNQEEINNKMDTIILNQLNNSGNG